MMYDQTMIYDQIFNRDTQTECYENYSGLAMLEVVVMSATIHAAPFVNFFGGPEKAHASCTPMFPDV